MKSNEIEDIRGSFGPVAIRALAVGAQSVGAIAVGAVALSAVAIGFIAIGRLVIGHAKIKRLEIGELRVTRLHVTDSSSHRRGSDKGRDIALRCPDGAARRPCHQYR